MRTLGNQSVHFMITALLFCWVAIHGDLFIYYQSKTRSNNYLPT